MIFWSLFAAAQLYESVSCGPLLGDKQLGNIFMAEHIWHNTLEWGGFGALWQNTWEKNWKREDLLWFIVSYHGTWWTVTKARYLMVPRNRMLEGKGARRRCFLQKHLRKNLLSPYNLPIVSELWLHQWTDLVMRQCLPGSVVCPNSLNKAHLRVNQPTHKPLESMSELWPLASLVLLY